MLRSWAILRSVGRVFWAGHPMPDASRDSRSVRIACPAQGPLLHAYAAHEMTDQGLTSTEAAGRLAQVGPNEPVAVRHLSILVLQLLRLFANPLVIILLVASMISALLGQVSDATIIVTMVVLGVGDQLLAKLPVAAGRRGAAFDGHADGDVCRDGAWAEIPIRGVVPGDLVRLSAGDLVPADSRVLEARDLSVQQSMLTGESLPAEKAPGQWRARKPGRRRRTWSSRHIRRQRHGHSACAHDRPAHALWRHRRAPACASTGYRVRARASALQRADPHDHDRPGALHRPGEHRLEARCVRIAALCGRAGRRADAGVSPDDQLGDARPGRAAHGAASRSSSSICPRFRTSAASTFSAATRPAR